MVREKNCLFCDILIKNVSKTIIKKLRKENPNVVFSYRPIGSFQKQKFCSPECGKLGGDFASGERNHNWRGGKSPLRNLLFTTREYKKWRTTIFKRDNWTCQFCEKRGGYLEADHIKPFALIVKENNIKSVEDAKQCDELWGINNGRTLCRECHIKTFIFLGNQYTV